MADHEFAVLDCSLVQRATGEWVSNLRELLRAVREMHPFVLQHHMMRCPLGDRFELDEFPNDFARWSWQDLGDRSAGELLALVEPYKHATLESLRAEIIDVIEEHLWSGEQGLRSCRPGLEFHLIASQLVAYETDMRIDSMAFMAENISRLSNRSLFYHVHEARRRTNGRTDDFSEWLEGIGSPPELIAAIRAIDFYYLNLHQLREALQEAFRPYFSAQPLSAAGTTP
jgi:hypothetical protein